MSRVLGVLLAVMLALAGAGCDEGSGTPGYAPSPGAPLDLNHATVRELEQLPAIGPKHARSIMASRNARGGRFERLEDLLAIDGIGEKTVEAIRPYVVLGP